MSNDREREAVVVTQGQTIPAPGISNVIDFERARISEPDESFNQSPPKVTDEMFPDVLYDPVKACCQASEAVQVAVAVNIIARFSALVGPTVYYQLGDENRHLNNYYLLVGPSGMGKGTSEYGPARIFKRVEEYLEVRFHNARESGQTDGITEYPILDQHEGGLSSGEGLAAAKNDGDPKRTDVNLISDKRFYIQEPEFGNVLNMGQRQGNTLSHVLRNGYDNKTIRPLTKRDKVCVTDPYFVMVGNITPGELALHDQTSAMSINGMLNRTLMIWTQLEKREPIPRSMPISEVDRLASKMAESVLSARNGSFETHWKKQQAQARPVIMNDQATELWIREYPALVNSSDCELVRSLCRRHRLHCLILASLFALMDQRMIMQAGDLIAALAWIRYSRQSVVYSYRSFAAQKDSQSIHELSMELLQQIESVLKEKPLCTCSDLYHIFGNHLTRDKLHAALECLLSNVPPLIEHNKIIHGRGRPTQSLSLTNEAKRVLNITTQRGEI